MKTLLKILLGVLALVVIVVLGGAAKIHFSGIPSYEVEEVNYQALATPENLQRGKQLVLTLCANCHRDTETGLLVGKEMKDAADFGVVYSQNITQDMEHGIGAWSDGDLLRLLRTGILPDGRYAPPYMVKLPHMADDDIEAIIAFLRSDDPLVAAQAVPDKACEPNFLNKFLCNVAFKPLPMPEHEIAMPDTSDKVAWGEYLTVNLDCWACHSQSFEVLNIAEPEKTPGYLGGGNQIPNMDGKRITSSNISSDEETGIGNWTEEAFIRAVKFGLKDGEEALRYPMLPFTHITDQEAAAIFAYLQSVPPIKNEVPRTE